MPVYLKQYREEPNAGDAASPLIVAHVTAEAVRTIGEAPFARPNLVALGSILHWADADSIVWGTGFISATVGLPARPRRVVAVRGPLTRARLLEFGVPCPEVFGDPGCFAPELFPRADPEFDLGIVPHLVDAAEPFIARARAAGAQIIDVRAPVADYLRALSACRRVISSSLHGVIFAHAYGIPAVWITLSSHVHGAGFKFRDYYASVGVASDDVPAFGSDSALADVADACALPPSPLDLEPLRRALLEALPDLQPRWVRRAISTGSARVVDRISQSPLFDEAAYVARYDDVRTNARSPVEHYALHGVVERRPPLREGGARRVLEALETDFDREAAAYCEMFDAAQADTPGDPGLVGLYCHTHAHYYMHSVAAAVAHALRRAGARCALLTEADPDPQDVECPLVIAPHEFFNMPLPAAFHDPAFVERAVMLNTEQVPSPWLLEALPWLYRARAIVDLGFQSSLVWRAAGIPSAHVLPPFDADQCMAALGDFDRTHPLVRWMDPDWLDLAGLDLPLADRPIDVFFAGHITPERTECFVRNAAFLARKRAMLAYAELSPVGTPLSAATRALFAVNIVASRLSKLVLSLNRYEPGYFTWERMVVQGFGCGTPVVTTPCLPSPFFDRTRHYFEAAPGDYDERVADLVDGTGGTADGQAAATAARSIMRERLTPERCGRFLLSFLADLPA